jgi:hypothetical protein
MTTARSGAGLPARPGPVPAEPFFSRTDYGACPGDPAPLPGRSPSGTTPSGQQDPPAMTGPAAGCRPGRDDLTARVFRALYPGFDLRTVGGIHIAVPKGALCFAGPSLGVIARQISDHEHPGPPASLVPPDSRHD